MRRVVVWLLPEILQFCLSLQIKEIARNAAHTCLNAVQRSPGWCMSSVDVLPGKAVHVNEAWLHYGMLRCMRLTWSVVRRHVLGRGESCGL